MAEIISVSLNPELLKRLDSVTKEMGFPGRSAVLRAGLQMLIREADQQKKLKGKIDATLLVIHEKKHSSTVSQIEHKYQDITKTQIHNVLSDNKCLEIFIVSGDAENIQKMTEEFRSNKDMSNVKLITS